MWVESGIWVLFLEGLCCLSYMWDFYLQVLWCVNPKLNWGKTMLRGTSVSLMVSMFLGIFIDGLWSPELLGHISPVVSVLLGILGNISSYEKLNVLQVSILPEFLLPLKTVLRYVLCHLNLRATKKHGLMWKYRAECAEKNPIKEEHGFMECLRLTDLILCLWKTVICDIVFCWIIRCMAPTRSHECAYN